MLQSINAGQLDLLIGSWRFERAHRDTDGLMVIALEGKVLRGAWTADNGQVTLFSAMIHGVGVTVAQIRVPEGTNEITQLDTVLAGVPVGTPERVIVTLDAAHTQRDTAEHLRAELGFDKPWQHSATSPRDCSSLTAYTKSKKQPRRSAATATAGRW